MSTERSNLGRGFAVTACAAMVAATVGGAAEASAVDQIERYCAASWRNAHISQQDWPDCTQQTLAELLERISHRKLSTAIEHGESQERRELNRAIWRVAQRWRRAARNTPYDLARCAEAADDGDNANGGNNGFDDALAAALDQLSSRQRAILTAWSQGHAISDIAEELNLSTARVSDEKYKAVRKLRGLLAAEAVG